jgi:hypothetical protein
VTLLVGLSELLALDLGDRNRQLDGLARPFYGSHLVSSLIGEQLAEMGLDCEARRDRVQGGVGLDLGGVEVQLLAPDQPGLAALLRDRLEEAAEYGQAIALPNPGQARVIGERLIQGAG